MKKSFRIIAIVLSVVMVLSFTACRKNQKQEDSSSETSSSDVYSSFSSEDVSSVDKSSSSAVSSKKASSVTTSRHSSGVIQTGTTSADPLDKGINLKGYIFRVYTNNDQLWNQTSNGSAKDNARVKMLKNIENKLNCKIKFVKQGAGTAHSNLLKKLLSGDKFADLLDVTMYESGSFIADKTAMDLKTVQSIDLSKPYWVKNFTNVATVKGKTYAASTYLEPHIMNENILFFNKSILTELGYSENYIYDLVNKKQWTIDEFIKLCQKSYKDMDGVGGRTEGDRYGLGGSQWQAPLTFFGGSGIHVLQNTKNGVVLNFKPSKNGPMNQDAINYINKLKTVLVKGNEFCMFKDSMGWTATLDSFLQGKSMFFSYMLSILDNPEFENKFKNMKNNYGVAPIPSPSVGSSYSNQVDWNSSVWIMPRNLNATDREKAGIVIESLAYHSFYDYVNTYIDDFSTKYFRDSQSAEMMNVFRDSPFYDLIYIAGNSDQKINDAITKYLVLAGTTTPGTQEIEKLIPMYEDSIRTAVDQFFNN